MTVVWIGVFLAASVLRLAWAWRGGHRAVGVVLSAVAAFDLIAGVDSVSVIQTPWSRWLMGAGAVVLVEVGMAAYHGANSRRVGILRTLRMLACWGVLVLVLQPAVELQPARKDLPTVAVLIDDSASMGISDEPKGPEQRLAWAAAAGVLVPDADERFANALAEGALLMARVQQGEVPEAGWIAAWETRLPETLKDEPAVKALRDEVHRRFDNKKPGTAVSGDDRRALEKAWKALAKPLREKDTAAHQARLDGLSDSVRAQVDGVAATSRWARAEAWLKDQEENPESTLVALRKHYEVVPMRFSDSVRPWIVSSNGVEVSTSGRTDVSGAMEAIFQQIGADALHGVVLLTDARHSVETPVDEALALYRRRRIPVSTVVHGSTRPPFDATLSSLQVPSTVFEGDRIVVRAEVRAGGMKGKQLKIRLHHGKELIEEREITVSEEDFAQTVRFDHLPEGGGLHGYRIEMDALEGELFEDNNSRDFEVAVSDDRVNVLLVDQRPRWEFRYLRNLFHRRDKSVHLQYVLIEPDAIAGQEDVELPPASAARPFGESQAGTLPETEDEWLAFDAILLGDVSPEAFTEAAWTSLKKAVVERGAMLVVTAGPEQMPHRHTHPVLDELLPVEVKQEDKDWTDSQTAYRLVPTWAGRQHPALQLSDAADEPVWDDLEAMWWRHPGITKVREGAEVLAWAHPVDALALPTGDPDFTEAADQALMVVRRTGLGRVVWLSFDRTWRLRYGVGDRYHHRFWGQLMRWGTGERLRGGTAEVRMGTDRLHYDPGEQVKLTVRLRDAKRHPVNGAEKAQVHWVPASDPEAKPVESVALRYRPGSSGVYDAMLTAPMEPGDWRVVAGGNSIEDVLEEAGESPRPAPSVSLEVRAPDLSRELARLGLDREQAIHWARSTGGVVVEPGEEAALLPPLLTRTPEPPPPVYLALWDRWISWILMLVLWSGEWWLRRRGGWA